MRLPCLIPPVADEVLAALLASAVDVIGGSCQLRRRLVGFIRWLLQ
jgi:hypothetical protein